MANHGLRAAILGCGGQGLRHAAILAQRGHRIVSVFDPDPKAAQALAVAYDAQVTPTFEDAVDMADLVVVASYDAVHGLQVIHALAEQKSVFCEKPLCTTLPDLAVIKRLYIESRSPGLAINYPLRQNPYCRALKGVIDRGTLGDISMAELKYLYGRIEKLEHGWRGQQPDYSPFLGGAIHLLDLYFWYFPNDEALQSRFLVAGQKHVDPSRTGVYDYESAIVQSEDGRMLTIVADFASQTPHRHEVRLSGKSGYAECSTGFGGSLWVSNQERRWPVPPWGGSLPSSLEVFLDTLASQVDREEYPESHVFWAATESAIEIAGRLRGYGSA